MHKLKPSVLIPLFQLFLQTAGEIVFRLGTTYSWSAPAVTGGITGGVASANQTTIKGTLTNPTNDVQTATYT